ncbi:UNVERIFIED_ORG: hypothetical protein J2X74_005480 [Bacillus sp. 1751]|nr:hypothetical protein [Bacillus sp. 1751]
MFKSFLSAELANHVGTSVEITLSDGFVEGIITSVTGNLLTILQTIGYGYGSTTVTLTIFIPAINSIRILSVA